MASRFAPGDPTGEDSDQGLDFLLHEGPANIICRISFEALRRQAGVAELSAERAERLFNWFRPEIERIALARYAAGDFSDGIVTIDANDIGSPATTRGAARH